MIETPPSNDPPTLAVDVPFRPDADPLPAHRPLDVVAFKSNHELFFALRDLTGIAPKSIAMSLPGYFVLALLDGRHTLADIQSEFEREFGRYVEPAEILHVIRDLDQALMLQTGRFESAYVERRDAYLSGTARDNRARANDAASLRDEILRHVLVEPVPTASGKVSGILAPHLDYPRGGPCYADAYRALLAVAPLAERYVILGTNHFGQGHDRVVASSKDFVTPLGMVPTDRAFLSAVERRVGCSIREFEFDHWAEHSIELHVHILQVAHAGRPFSIVPILCPDPISVGTADTASLLSRLAAALAAETQADRPHQTVLIASADLSHVGQRFGEPEPTGPEFLKRVEDSDRGYLELITRGDPNGFLVAVAEKQNDTRICSVGAIVAFRAALADKPLRLLRYHQATDTQNETHVTCAAAVAG